MPLFILIFYFYGNQFHYHLIAKRRSSMFESTLFYQPHSESCSPSFVSSISNIFQPCHPLLPFSSYEQCSFLQFLITCVAMTSLKYVVVDWNWKDLSAISTEERKRLSNIKSSKYTVSHLSFDYPRKCPSL